MLANLFTVTELEPPTIRSALADLLAVPDEAVDVADTDGDQETRRWDAPVLCTYRVLPLGDLALELDLYVEDRTAGALTEAALFRRDLQARDDLAQLATEVDDDHAEGLRSVLAQVDADFRKWAEPGVQEEAERWWWQRSPSPRSIPW